MYLSSGSSERSGVHVALKYKSMLRACSLGEIREGGVGLSKSTGVGKESTLIPMKQIKWLTGEIELD